MQKKMPKQNSTDHRKANCLCKRADSIFSSVGYTVLQLLNSAFKAQKQP